MALAWLWITLSVIITTVIVGSLVVLSFVEDKRITREFTSATTTEGPRAEEKVAA